MGNLTSAKKDSKKLDQFNKHRKCYSNCTFSDKYVVDQSGNRIRTCSQMNRLSLDFLDETFYNGINENEIKIEPLQVPLKAKSISKVRNKKYIKNPIRKNRIDHKPKTVHTKVKSSAIHFDHSPQIRKFLSVDFTSIDKKEEINDYKKKSQGFSIKNYKKTKKQTSKIFYMP